MIKKGVIFLIIILISGDIYSQDEDSIALSTVNRYLNAKKKLKKSDAKKILKLNPTFDIVYQALKQGKEYKQDVTKGFFEHTFINDKGIEHPNLVFIPIKYNPEQKYKVKIFLHGGVSNLDMRQIHGMINKSDTSWQSVNTICLYPSSWLFTPWWSYSQYENISNLLDFIKENYNIDENTVYVNGVSDGATGIFYLSNFYQTPFSCFLPFIGSMEMLTFNKSKQFYLCNYQESSFFIVNGRKDPVFDINFVIPSVSELKEVAKEVNFYVVDTSEHNIRWYPVLKDSIKTFINTHIRDPFPNRILYATEQPDTFNRKFWVKLDKIGKTKENGTIDDINQINLSNKTHQLFPRRKLFGQIEMVKEGNTVLVSTKDIKKYTLLISPDHFDISKPIIVYTNNKLSFEGILPKNLKVLLKYNLEDNDRTMLYSGEISIIVGKEFEKNN
ncbi:MAG: hypothetical protein AB9846_04495 [Tenuifilaceae bacterium]